MDNQYPWPLFGPYHALIQGGSPSHRRCRTMTTPPLSYVLYCSPGGSSRIVILHREITGSETANSHVGTTPNLACPGKLPLGTYHDLRPRRLAPWRCGELTTRLGACQVRPGMCFLVPVKRQECKIDVGVDWDFFGSSQAHLQQGRNFLWMSSALPRAHHARRSPANSGRLPRHCTPLQNQRRLFSSTPSTTSAVYTAAGPLESTARTGFRAPVYVPCSPPPLIPSISPVLPTTTSAARLAQQ
ncbi:uncharacterized protein EV420DRAFT_417966 [Desarmillaria tabescens]|uniref:Uncharacterized protein n=1 Tax=Armillaria tabescens TaxID=1929756 RepID=A0AA39J2H4_ARMTA|nr:uncharacterized protein EV420DRAFT_417966 [Desarmillaria tabescens]KAK0434265.1 hypothetical protein EV420DRAFT_417966 [Desarmillaria tabescens]